MALTPAQKQRRYRERVKERLQAEGRRPGSFASGATGNG